MVALPTFTVARHGRELRIFEFTILSDRVLSIFLNAQRYLAINVLDHLGGFAWLDGFVGECLEAEDNLIRLRDFSQSYSMHYCVVACT